MASLVRIHPMQHMTENRQKNNVQRGPFRFTQLWNDIIHHMKGHVEVKKRRHLVKNYDNCFIGTEAVDVLMNYLLTVSNILKCDITRDKAIKLAQALMDNNVFESVSSSSAQTAKKISFEDSASHLYRFCEDSTEASTQKVEKTPNTKRRSRRSSFGLPSKQKFVVKDVPKTPDTERVISNPLPFSPYGELFHRILQDSTCNDSQGNMSTASSTSIVQSRDIDDVWREVALERLLHVIDVPMLDHVLKCITDNKQEDSHNIVISNVFANTHSPAQTSTPSDGWIVSALDCLDQHPESLRIIESLIGSDGNISDASDIQEMDTLKKKALFKVVQDLYHGQREPLLPKGFFELYTAILTLLSNDQPEIH
uniref:DEP domain-containing protein 7-like n=1 Tax=Saccoglossus kowalevskii TaxID=10224 RepID=A0ABM0M957_SACKO|nr:PREDICTED: DEP domain-containing protein 7-like [Saccoglossus kowalevskii]